MNTQKYVAIIGSGPSGFYAAERLLRKSENIEVHMYEQLLTPYGLLRGGVAPDHQRMKSVASAYEKIASSDRFSFLGGIKVGCDIQIKDLQEHYNALIFATGANEDRPLPIQGTQLEGYHTATSFVGWYNSHPHFQDCSFKLADKSNIAIIGQGNVAVDVARILAKTETELADSDISRKALSEISRGNFKNIYLIGRRGPVQAAFTELEIKELASLMDAEPYVDPADLILSETDKIELSESSKARKNLAILEQYTQKTNTKQCTLHIKFLRSPIKIIGDTKVESIELEKNKLTGPAGSQKTQGTQSYETLPVDLVFTSIGYKGSPLPGLPFDQKTGTFPNINGRIAENDTVIPGLYTAGWIKRGPSGVIGTNRKDSFETVDNLLSDLAELPHTKKSPKRLLQSLSENFKTVSFTDWKKIDVLEIELGKQLNKAREKFDSSEEILKALAES